MHLHFNIYNSNETCNYCIDGEIKLYVCNSCCFELSALSISMLKVMKNTKIFLAIIKLHVFMHDGSE